MTGLDPLRLTARDAKRLLVDGEVSSAELAKVYLDQIAAVEDKVRAYILHTPDNAAKYSTKVDREMQAMRGPLAGLPIAVKDNMVTEGVTTTCASKILHNYQPVYTATAVRQVWEDHVVDARQDQPRRVRHGLLHRELGVPVTRESLGPGPRAGRHRAAARPRRWPRGVALAALGTRHGRLHPPARGPLRRRRHEADVRRASRATGWSRSAQLARPDRAVRPHGATTARSCCSASSGTTRATRPPSTVPGRSACADGRGLRRPARRRAEGVLPAGIDAGRGRAALRRRRSRALRGSAARSCRDLAAALRSYAMPTYYIIAPAEASATWRASTACATATRVRRPDDLPSMYAPRAARASAPEVKRRIMLGTYVLSAGYYDAYYGRRRRCAR